MNLSTKKVVTALVGLMPTVYSSQQHFTRNTPSMCRMRNKLTQALAEASDAYVNSSQVIAEDLFDYWNKPKFLAAHNNPTCCFCRSKITVHDTERVQSFMIIRTVLKIGEELKERFMRSTDRSDLNKQEKKMKLIYSWVYGSSLILMKNGRYSCAHCTKYLHGMYQGFVQQVLAHWDNTCEDLNKREPSLDKKYNCMAQHTIFIAATCGNPSEQGVQKGFPTVMMKLPSNGDRYLCEPRLEQEEVTTNTQSTTREGCVDSAPSDSGKPVNLLDEEKMVFPPLSDSMSAFNLEDTSESEGIVFDETDIMGDFDFDLECPIGDSFVSLEDMDDESAGSGDIVHVSDDESIISELSKAGAPRRRLFALERLLAAETTMYM